MSNSDSKIDFCNGERYIELNGINHWCKIAGIENNTIPFVIIHGGTGGNVYAFEKIIGPDLEELVTVIYYEQRGCGRSDSPTDENEYSFNILASDLAELCKKFNLNKIIPLGHSFGAQLAIEFTLSYPSLVDRLIIEAPTIFFEDGRNELTQMFGFELVSQGEVKDKIHDIISSSNLNLFDRWRKVWFTSDYHAKNRFMFYNLENAKKARKIWKSNPNSHSNMSAMALLDRKNEKSILDRVHSISVPTLIMVGLYDRNVGLDIPRDYADNIPNSKLILFEKSAHYPEIEEPEKFIKVIKDFLKI